MYSDNLSDDTLDTLEKAEQLKLQGKHEDAIAILEDLITEDPANVPALEELADNELSLDHYARAEAAAERAIVLDQGSYMGHYIMGFLRSQESKWETALIELRLANKLKANNPEILRCLGWALLRGGSKPEGVVTLERALNLDNDNPLTLCDLGVAHLELKNTAKARLLFQRALELDPQNARARECVDMVGRLERHEQTARH